MEQHFSSEKEALARLLAEMFEMPGWEQEDAHRVSLLRRRFERRLRVLRWQLEEEDWQWVEALATVLSMKRLDADSWARWDARLQSHLPAYRALTLQQPPHHYSADEARVLALLEWQARRNPAP